MRPQTALSRRLLASLSLAVAAALALPAAQAAAPADVKAASCLYEIQAEAWRFVRLQREIAAGGPAVAGNTKLRSQIKASTQELMLNLREAQPGLQTAGLSAPLKQLEEGVADYLAEAATAAGDPTLAGLRGKQASVLKLADDLRKGLEPKLRVKSAAGINLIGGTKLQIERLAYDFEFCDKAACKQQLVPAVEQLDRQLEAMRTQLPQHFSTVNYELAKNQLVFVRLAIDARLRTGSAESGQANLITTTARLWELVDTVLDSFADKGGN